jgi:hypothetical protein
MRNASLALLVVALVACRKGSPAAPDAAIADEPDAFAPGAPRARAPACRPVAVSWYAPPAAGERLDDGAGVVSPPDAGDALFPPIESATMATVDTTQWLLWADARDHALHLGRAPRSAVTTALTAGNRGEALLSLAGPQRATPVAVWAYDTPAGRLHTVRGGEGLDAACTQPEARDEALAVSTAVTSQGVLVAWDDDGPSGGAVKVQVVPVPVPSGQCPAPRQVSPPDQDAGDPLVVAAPDGGAVIAWLSARELERDQNNDTATDVWALALDARGASLGTPVRVTTSAGHRFGLAAAVSPDGASVWLAYRVVPDSGTEARGDGGSVALTRLARNAQGLARLGDPMVMTANDANPTAAVRVFAYNSVERPVDVWWRDRRGAAVTTMRRSCDATGSPSLDAPGGVAEPALHGELPAWMDPRGAVGAWIVRTPGGGVGVARIRCGAALR